MRFDADRRGRRAGSPRTEWWAEEGGHKGRPYRERWPKSSARLTMNGGARKTGGAGTPN